MALKVEDILMEKKLLSPETLKAALNEQALTGEVLWRVLIRMNIASEEDVLKALAENEGAAFINLKDARIDAKAVKSVPAKLVWHYKIMPVGMSGNAITVATADPLDVWTMEDLEAHLGLKVENVLATSSDITETAKKYYGVGAETIERIMADAPSVRVDASPVEKIDDLEKMAESASVIKLVNQILQQAITDRATDIHLESFRQEASLRYRVDGILYETQISENLKYLYPAIISRIKVMSNLDIVERRLPQDGRAKVRIGAREYELRVSVMPTLYGENIAIRILPTTMLFDLADLGINPRDLGLLEELIARPHGIIFVTGPTGSGKTTTLYAALSKLNTRQRKIVTIENPIEYELKGISQTQVNPKINLTFATTLRSMLRHDPDIMMVGEVRDRETAEITIQTALTGHLVFSTIHTNDAASGATRLIDIGIEPYLIASSVNAFIAQRLVRVICEKCKTEVKLDAANVKIDGIVINKQQAVYAGKGCKACNDTGYFGRTGIYEILIADEHIKELIIKKAPSDIIKARAIESGMHTLRQDGWNKVLAGITTAEEIMRVTQLEK